MRKQRAKNPSVMGTRPPLHLWWARRPLAAARAVIWSSLVDDPLCPPGTVPHRGGPRTPSVKGCFTILEKLVKWENSNDPEVLDAAKAEICALPITTRRPC